MLQNLKPQSQHGAHGDYINKKNIKRDLGHHVPLFFLSALKQQRRDLIVRSNTICEELWEFFATQSESLYFTRG